MFDALLLPPMAVDNQSTAEPPSTRKPDPSQHRAAAHRGYAFQLQAGPGTGKTRTLLKRVLSLLAEGVDPAAILILTFSNRAAGELSERLTAGAQEALPRLWIGTFPAFGLDLVRRYHDKLGLVPNPSLFDRSDAIEVLEDILPTLPLVHYRNLWDPAIVLRDIVGAISRAKDEMVGPERYRALAEAMEAEAADRDVDAQIAAAKCLEIADIYDLYEEALRNHGGVDFGDLIMRPARLLEDDEAVRIGVQLRHRARARRRISGREPGQRASAEGGGGQWRAALGRRRCAAGDLSLSRCFLRKHGPFGSDYPGAAMDQLHVNYRSTEQIVHSLVAVAPNMGASNGMLPSTWRPIAAKGQAVPRFVVSKPWMMKPRVWRRVSVNLREPG